eukprot:TRINITY_DN2852_c0_g1_i1.p1 TRINITY_DN2852_c0_g1~~TRINITY_DN2852_c0_g1_i1.p1  ORF type:complete len:1432 (-),score=454.04 TRINITY_DN2852_c0_g1_i1:258-4553(-)
MDSRTNGVSDGKRKAQDEVDDGAEKRRKIESIKGKFVLNQNGKIVEVEVSQLQTNPTVLGRNNPQLANVLDSFVSRVSATAYMDDQGVKFTVEGSNPVRVVRKDGKEEILRKGAQVTLADGDTVELAFNPTTKQGRGQAVLHLPKLVKEETPPPTETKPASQTVKSSSDTSEPMEVQKPSNSPAPPKEVKEEEADPLKDWMMKLKDLGGQNAAYFDNLQREGFTTLETIKDLSVSDLNELGFKLAHRKAFFNHIQALKETPQTTDSTQVAQSQSQEAPQSQSQQPSADTSLESPKKSLVSQPTQAFPSATQPLNSSSNLSQSVDGQTASAPSQQHETSQSQSSPVKEDKMEVDQTPKESPKAPKQEDDSSKNTEVKKPEEEQVESEENRKPSKEEVEPEPNPEVSEEPPEEEPELCSRCNTCTASIECSRCGQDEEAVKYCFKCSMKVHKGIPLDQDPHIPESIDDELMEQQRRQVEEEELAMEQSCVNVSKQILGQLGELLKQPIGSQARIEAFLKEKEAIDERCRIPETVIVVMGDTGAGKSSMLNALLGEESVLPTNSMRACTAVLIELRHNKEPQKGKYIGEIEFLKKEEWDKELDILFTDLKTEEGKIIKKPDPKSDAGVALSKIKVVYGSIDFKVIKSADDLRRRGNEITRCLGTTKIITESDPHKLRKEIEKYADSANKITDLAHWPLVKRICLKGPWEVLRSGAVLVDAPGVRDDNSARDAVVKGYLKSGNSIWIVANIKRAVNDKTAKDMLGESFRRQLLMDGQYGTLAFVATHCDQGERSELIDNLDLAPDTTFREAAKARNNFTKNRIKEDFKLGLEEMSTLAGGTQKTREFYLPVFTVSSLDFQKICGLRPGDGGPSIWGSSEDTEIPTLRRYVYATTIRRRYESMVKLCESLLQLLANVEHFLSDDGTANEDLRKIFLDEFSRSKSHVHVELQKHLMELKSGVSRALNHWIVNKLPEGITTAEQLANQIVNKEGSRLKYPSYRAAIRREGVYNSGAAGRINFNEDLVEPIYRQISVNWDRMFGEELAKLLNEHLERILQSGDKVVFQFARTLSKYGVQQTRITTNATHARNDMKKKLLLLFAEIQHFVVEEQKNISRILTPLVQQFMGEAYQGCNEEWGTGCFNRMKNLMNQFVDQHKHEMYTEASKALLGALTALVDQIYLRVDQIHHVSEKELELHNSLYWENPMVAGTDPKYKTTVLPVLKQYSQILGEKYKKVKVEDEEPKKEEGPNFDLSHHSSTPPHTTPEKKNSQSHTPSTSPASTKRSEEAARSPEKNISENGNGRPEPMETEKKDQEISLKEEKSEGFSEKSGEISNGEKSQVTGETNSVPTEPAMTSSTEVPAPTEMETSSSASESPKNNLPPSSQLLSESQPKTMSATDAIALAIAFAMSGKGTSSSSSTNSGGASTNANPVRQDEK